MKYSFCDTGHGPKSKTGVISHRDRVGAHTSTFPHTLMSYATTIFGDSCKWVCKTKILGIQLCNVSLHKARQIKKHQRLKEIGKVLEKPKVRPSGFLLQHFCFKSNFIPCNSEKMSQSVWDCGDMGKNSAGKILSSSLIKPQTRHSHEALSYSEVSLWKKSHLWWEGNSVFCGWSCFCNFWQEIQHIG